MADYDIGIDFGKLFKSWKKPSQESANSLVAQSLQHSEQETIHNTVTSTPAPQSRAPSSSSIDLKTAWLSTKKFTKKNYVWIILIVLLALQFIPNHGFFPCTGSIYCPWGAVWTRMQSSKMPAADDWAGAHINNNVRSQLENMIAQQYPNLPSNRRAQLLEQEWTKYKTTNKDQLTSKIKELGQQFRSFYQYDFQGSNFVYPPDIDPYYYLRYARNLIDKGQTGDIVKDGKQWDNHMVAPIGNEVEKNILPYLLAWWHKIAKLSGMDILQSGASFPVAMAVLFLIPAFFVGRKLGGIVGAITSASAIGLNTAIFSRTTWGHPDTDVFNILFPLFIVWMFIESIDAHDSKKRWIFTSLTGLTVGLYSIAWSGWWYMFDFLLAAMAVYVLYELAVDTRLRVACKQFNWQTLTHHPAWKIVRISIALFIISLLFVSLFQGFDAFLDAFKKPFAFTKIDSASRETLWPNVFTTVAELNPGSTEGIITSVTGWDKKGKFAVFLSLLGLAWFAYAFRKRPERMTYSILILIWLIATFYASLKGIRFTLLMGPAYALGLGALAGMLHNTLTPWLKKIKIPSLATGALILILFSLVLLPQAESIFYGSHGDVPIINDAWVNVLTQIRQNSAPDAILNSWWDYGHHFKFFSDRAVTFDGASQSKPQAHWIGRVLLTNNEDEAIGILKMLDCGSNKAFDVLDTVLQNTPKSVQLLHQIMLRDKNDALQSLLDKNLSQEVANQVISLTHCTPPEDYFITSDDMVGKSGVWAHFGSWDFDKALVWQTLRKQSRNEAINTLVQNGKSADESSTLYDEAQTISSEKDADAWIAPWHGFVGGSFSSCEQKEGIIRCGNGLMFNLSSNEVRMVMEKGIDVPQVMVFVNQDGKFERKEFNNSNIDLGVALFPHPYGGLASIFMSPALASSMFTRLYFFQGHDLIHFKHFATERFLHEAWVSVWKLDWENTENQKMSSKK